MSDLAPERDPDDNRFGDLPYDDVLDEDGTPRPPTDLDDLIRSLEGTPTS